MAQQFKDAGVDVQGMFTNDIVGSSRGDDGTRDRTSVRLFAQGPPPSEDADDRGPAAHARRRERLAGARARPLRHRGRRTHDDRHGRPGDLPARPLPARRRPHPGSWQQGFPAARFTEPNENFAHQHQDVRVENGVQFGDLPEFCDFDYIAQRRQGERRRAVVAAQAPGMPQDVRIDTSVLTNDTKLLLDPRGRRVAGRLRGRLAADDQPVLDACHPGRRRRRPRRSTCRRTT